MRKQIELKEAYKLFKNGVTIYQERYEDGTLTYNFDNLDSHLLEELEYWIKVEISLEEEIGFLMVSKSWHKTLVNLVKFLDKRYGK